MNPLQSKENVKAAQVLGIIVLLLAYFGVDVNPETEKAILGGLLAVGTVITTVADVIDKRRVRAAAKLEAEVAAKAGGVLK